MRDLVHGVIGAVIAYAAFKLAGHAIWALVGLGLYFPIYLKLRDHIPRRKPGSDRDRDVARS